MSLGKNNSKISKRKTTEFNRVLFRFHKTNYREMAWRNTHDPYRILVSEIMLQQTQVARVKEKYAQFIKKFPRVKDLAQASLAEVLTLWSGLGYNRRAKFLHQCAKEIIALDGGKFPETLEELVKLQQGNCIVHQRNHIPLHQSQQCGTPRCHIRFG